MKRKWCCRKTIPHLSLLNPVKKILNWLPEALKSKLLFLKAELVKLNINIKLNIRKRVKSRKWLKRKWNRKKERKNTKSEGENVKPADVEKNFVATVPFHNTFNCMTGIDKSTNIALTNDIKIKSEDEDEAMLEDSDKNKNIFIKILTFKLQYINLKPKAIFAICCCTEVWSFVWYAWILFKILILMICPLGEFKKHKLLVWISSKAFPIPFGYIDNHGKLKNPSWSWSAAPRPPFSDQKIQRIFKISKGKNFQHVFYFFVF